MTFDNWMESVNKFFAVQFGGATADDFEDWLWYDDFTSGLSPQEAFREWREENV